MLYLVATPIGNLKDLSFRAQEVLAQADFILAEDTRHTHILLKHYNIKKPLVSYHKFNEASRLNRVVSALKQGQTVALVSDAGSPLVADPGFRLIRRLEEEGLPFTTIPGACSVIAALQLSGFEASRFQFLGFAPRKKGQMTRLIQEMAVYPGLSLFFESSHRIIPTLKAIEELLPNRRIAVIREITKQFEEVKKGTATELLPHFQNPRGEFVVAIPEE